MQLIQPQDVQARLNGFIDQDLYLHLEMTTGAYANHYDSTRHPASAFISNAAIRYTQGSISGTNPYRVGLKRRRVGFMRKALPILMKMRRID